MAVAVSGGKRNKRKRTSKCGDAVTDSRLTVLKLNFCEVIAV